MLNLGIRWYILKSYDFVALRMFMKISSPFLSHYSCQSAIENNDHKLKKSKALFQGQVYVGPVGSFRQSKARFKFSLFIPKSFFPYT